MEGTPWLVEEVVVRGGFVHRVPEGKVVTFEIKDGRAGMRVCNRMGSAVEVRGARVEFKQWTATMMLCSGALGELEGALYKALTGGVVAEVGPERLTLTGADGAVVRLRYDLGPPLVGTKWHAVEQPPRGGLWIRFTGGGRVEGRTGCNGFGGPARVHDTGPIDYGDLLVTLVGCDADTGAYEKRLLAVLHGRGRVVDRRAGTLVLRGEDGTTMEFTARP
ncbi:META domain-containing protein [Streptomyces polyrhachis]|uniref:META domain-containing protein n=1 Tax=Streptomyces polyrhachis TaxID=1282885 RepID=A0ABW2GDQ7_9ACTN